MRKLAYVGLLISALLISNGCSNINEKTKNNNTLTNDSVVSNYQSTNKSTINKDKDIEKVTISASMGPSKSVESKDKIKEIIGYLNNLDLSVKINNDKELYMGMTYTMTVYYSNKTSEDFFLDANKVLHFENANYKISYSQAEKLKDIYTGL